MGNAVIKLLFISLTVHLTPLLILSPFLTLTSTIILMQHPPIRFLPEPGRYDGSHCHVKYMFV